MIKPIRSFKITCHPFTSYSIRCMEVIIYAESREKAEQVMLKHAHEFFDQSLNMVWEELPYQGFMEVDKDASIK